MSAGGVLVAAAPSIIATVGGAAILGAVKWVKLLSGAMSRLTDVAETLGDVSGDLLRLREDFTAHCREADDRWRLVGGTVHPRYWTADDRVPAPAAPAEP